MAYTHQGATLPLQIHSTLLLVFFPTFYLQAEKIKLPRSDALSFDSIRDEVVTLAIFAPLLKLQITSEGKQIDLHVWAAARQDWKTKESLT